MRLIDADELKEEITSHFDLELEPVIEKEVLRMIDEQETISAASPKWVSVKDRLPEELTPVNVVWVNHNPQLYYSKIKDVPQSNATAVYFCGRWYWWDAVLIDWLGEYGRGREESLVDKEIEITHWMPLPEPPMEAKE